MNLNKKVCFIIPLYGKVPVYLNIFLKSAEFNKNFTFIFFTDLDLKCKLAENIRRHYCSLDDFRRLIHKKTGVKPTFDKYYKIVDFKPAYGMIFQEYISEFDYWGMLDVDLILGEIDKFITPELLEKYDIISARKYWLSGSFALFKNCEKVNTLLKKARTGRKFFPAAIFIDFVKPGPSKILAERF